MKTDAEIIADQAAQIENLLDDVRSKNRMINSLKADVDLAIADSRKWKDYFMRWRATGHRGEEVSFQMNLAGFFMMEVAERESMIRWAVIEGMIAAFRQASPENQLMDILRKEEQAKQ